MVGPTRASDSTLSRRAFLGTTGTFLMAASTPVVPAPPNTAPRQPQRGGSLRFATRTDTTGLDPHRNTFYPVSMPVAAMSQGLLDLNLHSEPVPGIASEWDATPDLLTYTFKLRPGVLFHNGREIDAAAVQWNLARLKDPHTSSAFARSVLENLFEVRVLDKYTLRCHLHQPSAAFPADMVYYPCALIAPDSAAQADVYPIGCGPFKFVRWERNQVTELVRFADYFETDAAGNSLPYLERILGYPRKEDAVRLAALRAGEVDLIDSMAAIDAVEMPQKYTGIFQTWEVATLGTSFLLFNLDTGPFTDKRVRHAAAHAVDREAIHQAVFYGQGAIARSFYAPASPWYTPDVRPAPEYDPDKARFLLRQAKAVGAEVRLQAEDAYPYMRHTADLLQAMWADVGFKVAIDILSGPSLQHRRRARDFHAESLAASYRFDPDGWFARQVLSTAPTTQENSGFRHAAVDRLIVDARQTVNKSIRLALYTEIESLINEELPLLYLHHLTLLEAGVLHLQGYQPAISGPFSTRGGGLRTAWLA